MRCLSTASGTEKRLTGHDLLAHFATSTLKGPTLISDLRVITGHIKAGTLGSPIQVLRVGLGSEGGLPGVTHPSLEPRMPVPFTPDLWEPSGPTGKTISSPA